MRELRQGFGLTARPVAAGVPGPADTVSTSLEAKAAGVRLIGEVLAFTGLLVLLAALFFWRHISGYDFIRSGWIDLPTHVAAAWHYAAPKIGHVLPSEYRHDPYGVGFFTVVLWFVTFSALLRKRQILAWLILAFCIVPWPVFGLTISGIGFAAAMILGASLIAAWRQRDFARAGMFLFLCLAVWQFFSLDFMDALHGEERPAVRFAAASTPGAIKLVRSQRSDKLTTIAELKWPESLEDAKAYLVAQDSFFRGEAKVIAENLPRAKAAFGADMYASLRIAGLEQYVLSQGIGSPEALAEYQTRRWRMTVATNALLGLGFVLIVIGFSIEWVAGRIRGRMGRLDILSQKVATARAKRVPDMTSSSIPGDSIFAESLRKIRYRLRWAIGIAAPFVIGAVILALLALYLQVPSAHTNDGFDTVHMLGPVFDNFPEGFDNVTANQRLLLVPPTVWPYILGVLLALILLGLRRFRLFLALILFMVLGQQLSSFVFPRSGLVEIAVSNFKPGTIRSIEAASSVSIPNPDPKDDRKLEAYYYTLAQLSYLAGNPAQTAEEIAAVGTLDFWAYPSVEWRLAIMREWLASNRIVTVDNKPASDFAMPEDGRAVSALIARAALLLIGLGSPPILLALVYLWRRRRLSDLQNAHAQLGAVRRASNLVSGGS